MRELRPCSTKSSQLRLQHRRQSHGRGSLHALPCPHSVLRLASQHAHLVFSPLRYFTIALPRGLVKDRVSSPLDDLTSRFLLFLQKSSPRCLSRNPPSAVTAYLAQPDSTRTTVQVNSQAIWRNLYTGLSASTPVIIIPDPADQILLESRLKFRHVCYCSTRLAIAPAHVSRNILPHGRACSCVEEREITTTGRCRAAQSLPTHSGAPAKQTPLCTAFHITTAIPRYSIFIVPFHRRLWGWSARDSHQASPLQHFAAVGILTRGPFHRKACAAESCRQMPAQELAGVKIVLCLLRVLTQASKLPVCRIQQRLESPSDCLEPVRTKQSDRAHSEDRSTKFASQVKVLSLSLVSYLVAGLVFSQIYISL
jgi:hypothetical protein